VHGKARHSCTGCVVKDRPGDGGSQMFMTKIKIFSVLVMLILIIIFNTYLFVAKTLKEKNVFYSVVIVSEIGWSV
jgi:hypothetical protein